MKLSETERLNLFLRYEALRQIAELKGNKSEAKHCDILQEALQRGYEFLYDQLLPDMYPPMNESSSKVVLDILDMYMAVGDALPDEYSVPDDVKFAVQFSGFDGNNESEEFGFCLFYVDRLKNYQSLRIRDFNSHCPMMDTYQRMLRKWDEFDRSLNLTPEQAIAILRASRYSAAA